MESSQAILWMIGACALLMGILLFSKQLKFLLKFIVRGVVGLCGVFLANIVVTPLLGISVGINILTGFIIGVLGVPGFISLYIAGYFL